MNPFNNDELAATYEFDGQSAISRNRAAELMGIVNQVFLHLTRSKSNPQEKYNPLNPEEVSFVVTTLKTVVDMWASDKNKWGPML